MKNIITACCMLVVLAMPLTSMAANDPLQKKYQEAKAAFELNKNPETEQAKLNAEVKWLEKKKSNFTKQKGRLDGKIKASLEKLNCKDYEAVGDTVKEGFVKLKLLAAPVNSLRKTMSEGEVRKHVYYREWENHEKQMSAFNAEAQKLDKLMKTREHVIKRIQQLGEEISRLK